MLLQIGDKVKVDAGNYGQQIGTITDLSPVLVWVSLETVLLVGQGKLVCSHRRVLEVVREADANPAVCPFLLELSTEKRPANALNLEIGCPANRCLLKTPKSWNNKITADRWLSSGGSPFVLGACSSHCPNNL